MSNSLICDLQDAVTPLSESEAVDLVKTVFASATERDIYTVSYCSPSTHSSVRSSPMFIF